MGVSGTPYMLELEKSTYVCQVEYKDISLHMNGCLFENISKYKTEIRKI